MRRERLAKVKAWVNIALDVTLMIFLWLAWGACGLLAGLQLQGI